MESEEWTADANEAVKISLVVPAVPGKPGVKRIETFGPEFSYAIFGEEERIFGYKDLKINLQFNASDLRPNLAVSSSRKFKSVGGVEAVDVAETMKEFLPAVAFQKKADFELGIAQVADDWTPPGELVKTVQRNGEVYEVWRGSLDDEKVKQLVNRIQICVLFFIEGGSYIGKDAEGNEEPDYALARWSVFFLYKKMPMEEAQGRTQYVFQGYSTVYHFWLLNLPTPPASPASEPALIQPKTNDTWELPEGNVRYADLPHRARISQFVILPPFQGKGAGSILYSTIFETKLKDIWTKEVTVEDPNEAFDLLRDVCDLKYLINNVPEFANLTINDKLTVPRDGGILHHDMQLTTTNKASSGSPEPIVDMVALEKMRLRVKIAPRQFARLVEMYLMSKLPASVQPLPEPEGGVEAKAASAADKNLYTLWRLLLKQRLYRRNIQALAEFEVSDRIIKLNDTLANVEWEYARILVRFQLARTIAAGQRNGKRKADEGAAGEAGGEPAGKKARVEDA